MGKNLKVSISLFYLLIISVQAAAQIKTFDAFDLKPKDSALSSVKDGRTYLNRVNWVLESYDGDSESWRPLGGVIDAYTKAESDDKYLLNTTDTFTGNLSVVGRITASVYTANGISGYAGLYDLSNQDNRTFTHKGYVDALFNSINFYELVYQDNTSNIISTISTDPIDNNISLNIESDNIGTGVKSGLSVEDDILEIYADGNNGRTEVEVTENYLKLQGASGSVNMEGSGNNYFTSTASQFWRYDGDYNGDNDRQIPTIKKVREIVSDSLQDMSSDLNISTSTFNIQTISGNDFNITQQRNLYYKIGGIVFITFNFSIEKTGTGSNQNVFSGIPVSGGTVNASNISFGLEGTLSFNDNSTLRIYNIRATINQQNLVLLDLTDSSGYKPLDEIYVNGRNVQISINGTYYSTP